MFAIRFANGGIDPEPVAHDGDFAKRHAALGHTEWAGVHAKENNFLFCGCGEVEVLLVRGPRVIEGVVDMGHRGAEGQGVAVRAEISRGLDHCLQHTHSAGLKPLTAQR